MMKRLVIAVAALFLVSLPSVASSPACSVIAALPVAAQVEAAAASEPQVAGGALQWRLDDERLAATIDAQSGAKARWDDLSKTTKFWFIVGGVVVGLIVVAALD